NVARDVGEPPPHLRHHQVARHEPGARVCGVDLPRPRRGTRDSHRLDLCHTDLLLYRGALPGWVPVAFPHPMPQELACANNYSPGRLLCVNKLPETEDRAWRAFLHTHARVIRRLDAELQAERGLTLSAYEVLLRLRAAPKCGLRMTQLAEEVLLSPSGCTRV